METKIVRVGNSKGIRLPKRLLVKYGLGESVIITELGNGILIEGKDDNRPSWEDTYKEIASSDEDWSDWAELDIGNPDED